MLLLLHPYKFTEYFYKKYDLDVLENKLRARVEVHDLSNIVNPDWGEAFKGKRYKKAKVFNSISEWKSCFNKILAEEKNLVVYNLVDIHKLNSLIIHYIIFKSNVKVLQIRSLEACFCKTNLHKKINFKLIFKVIKLTFTNISKILFYMKSKFFSKVVLFLKYKELFIIYAGKKKNINPNVLYPLNAEKTIYIKNHSFDYSKFLLNKKKLNKKKTSRKYIVFLDSVTPYFIGDKKLFKQKLNYEPAIWYRNLNNFLKKVEQSFNAKIIIIPHPRVRGAYNPYYDRNFEICSELNGSCKLIPKSKFVMAISATTAVSYCVANYKPIVLIFNEQLKKKNPTMLIEMKYMSKVLNTSLINIDKTFTKDKLIKPISKKIYDKYKYEYLTSKEINNKMNYDILNSYFFNRR